MTAPNTPAMSPKTKLIIKKPFAASIGPPLRKRLPTIDMTSGTRSMTKVSHFLLRAKALLADHSAECSTIFKDYG